MHIQTRAKNGGTNQQVSIEDGMGGEGDLEARVVGQEMQVSIEDNMGGEGDLEAGVVKQEMQVSTRDGMRSERDLEARVVGQEMQVLAKNVVALVALEIVQQQVLVGGDVGKAHLLWMQIKSRQIWRKLL